LLETEAAKRVFLKSALPVRSILTDYLGLKHSLNSGVPVLPTAYLSTSKAALALSKKSEGYAAKKGAGVTKSGAKTAYNWMRTTVLNEEHGAGNHKSSLRAPIMANLESVDVGIYSID